MKRNYGLKPYQIFKCRNEWRLKDTRSTPYRLVTWVPVEVGKACPQVLRDRQTKLNDLSLLDLVV